MKHTPGPWKVDKSSWFTKVYTQRENYDDEQFICTTDYSGLDLNDNQANARLIASAPELLDSLESILEDVYFEENKGCYGISADKLLKAKAIIAKANGE